MEAKPYILHALSPLHAGTGQAADIIDLPIARLRATGIPFVPGSSIKGVLRDVRREQLDDATWKAVFGPDTASAAEHAGALIVTDARLLALPVRSFRGTFAWVTSPLLLTLARRDLADERWPAVPQGLNGSHRALLPEKTAIEYRGKIYLEDLDLPAEKANGTVAAWSQRLAEQVFGGDREMFATRFVVVDDETMTFLWETATQVDARVRIDGETRTVAEGALWLEESLPPETLLIGVLLADRSRKKGIPLDPAAVLAKAVPTSEVIQFGGKATVGRGRCRLVPLAAGTTQ